MTSTEANLILIFHSVHHAIWAESVLRKGGIACKMIPIPRSISSDCGVCVRIASADESRAAAALSSLAEEWRIEPYPSRG